MNLSSLSGDSLAAILPAGADYTLATLSTAGTVINYTGKGVFGLFSTTGANVIRLTVDGVQFADMTWTELSDGLGIVTASDRFRFNKSLKVEIITFSSGGVNVSLIGA